ncbi:MAG: 3-oxoacyl-[acyl-carrier-protein] synthase III C-terminal domain-containing protein [Syntrophales bacterium]|nr:3-oxoacyl-[acyl-carrier-protein] synthase III C-terminal domain-containing protein [Syntrophales bacterium]
MPLKPPFPVRFESVGAKVPEGRLSTKDLMAQVNMWVDVDLEDLTGIRERRVCSDGEDSFTLSVDAARECLKHSSYEAGDLEMIICCSISKFKDGLTYSYEPSFSLQVKEAIGAKKALTFDVANACAGMLTGIFVMNDFIKRGVIKCGMVISGEYITSLAKNAIPHVKTVLSGQLPSLTVGDCGAAVILERSSPGRAALGLGGFITLSRWSELCIGGACMEAPGGEMTTDGRKIHQVAISDSPPILEKALKECGMNYGDIDHFIPHQTSTAAITAGNRRLSRYFSARPKNVVVNLQEYGNTASTSHFLAMYRLLKEKRFKPGENILLMAMASGLVLGVVTLTMDEMVYRYGYEG